MFQLHSHSMRTATFWWTLRPKNRSIGQKDGLAYSRRPAKAKNNKIIVRIAYVEIGEDAAAINGVQRISLLNQKYDLNITSHIK